MKKMLVLFVSAGLPGVSLAQLINCSTLGTEPALKITVADEFVAYTAYISRDPGRQFPVIRRGCTSVECDPREVVVEDDVKANAVSFKNLNANFSLEIDKRHPRGQRVPVYRGRLVYRDVEADVDCTGSQFGPLSR